MFFCWSLGSTLLMLKDLPHVTDVTPINGSALRVTLDTEVGDISVIAQQLIASGFRLTRLEEEKVNLETAFMRLTKGLVQ